MTSQALEPSAVDRPEEALGGQMTLLEHLMELRRRLIYSIATLIAALPPDQLAHRGEGRQK